MTEHTPGPWTIDGTDEGYTVLDPDMMIIAETFGFSGDLPDREGQEEANARLIAAAPAMLAALREVVGACIVCQKIGAKCWEPAHPAARDAIAAATGDA